MKKGTKLLLALLCVMGVASLSGNSVDIHETPVVATAGLTQGLEGDPINNNSEIQSYYSGIDSSLTGNELLSALRTLNTKERTSTPGYGGHWNYFNQTDYHPDNKNKYVAYYRGTASDKGAMNKEHVWPDSRGGNLVENDIHVIRPTLTADNSSRGNAFYVEGGTSQSGWDPYADGMTERYRGDAARIVFYAVIANSSLSLVDTTNDKTSNKTMGKLSDLLKWNLKYPVDQTEINRNNGAENIQGNRNPFIDDRSLACKIWGDYNENTRNVCKDSIVSNEPPTSISLTPSNPTINVGSSVTLSVNISPSNASNKVMWTSSNSSVATVSSGIVTGIKEGTATISAISELDSSIRGEVTVTVRSIKSISLSGKPSKSVYTEGETFNPSGLTVTATFTDNSTSVISNSSVTWLDGVTLKTTLSKGTTSVIAKCGTVQTIYNGIVVNEKTQPKGCSLLKDTSDLSAGSKVILANKDNQVVAGELSGKYLSKQSATFSSDKEKITDYSNALIFTLGGKSGAWTFDYEGSLLGATSDKSLAFGSGTTTWDIEISSGSADISSTNSSYGKLQYNEGAPRFVNYKSATQKPLNIYLLNDEVAPKPDPEPPITSGGGTTVTPPTTSIPNSRILISLSKIGEVTKLSYFEGEVFDPSGLIVMAHFDNGDVDEVTSEVVWPSTGLKISDTAVIGTYTSNGVTLSIEVNNIFVIASPISSNNGCGKASLNILCLVALFAIVGTVVLKKKY